MKNNARTNKIHRFLRTDWRSFLLGLRHAFKPSPPVNPIINLSEPYLEVYLIYTPVSRRERRGHFGRFFSYKMRFINEYIKDKPLFFNKEMAMRYSRFQDDNHVILRLVVPETSVESIDQQAYLKTDAVTNANVRGLYPGWDNNATLVANPWFNAKLCKAIKTLSPLTD